jgi:hypothetical protein
VSSTRSERTRPNVRWFTQCSTMLHNFDPIDGRDFVGMAWGTFH